MSNNPFLQGKSSARSLNRAQIVTLGGLNPPDGVLGLRGYPGLSAASIHQKIRTQAADLNLNPDSKTLISDFETLLADPIVGRKASEIAHDYGRQLGYLLLMLKRGDAENRAARPEWTDEHWTYWANVRNVMFGGGVMSGVFGRKALLTATNILATHGYPHVTLQQSPHGSNIGLIGLANAVDQTATSALLLDFGQTSVKRAVVQFGERGIESLQSLPSVPAHCYSKTTGKRIIDAQARWEWLLNVLRESWRPVDAISMSVATYLQNGNLVSTQHDCYGCMHTIIEHLPTFIRNQLREKCAIDVPLTLLHDGTAAAAAHPEFDGVVITIGTALGVGFPEEITVSRVERLLPL